MEMYPLNTIDINIVIGITITITPFTILRPLKGLLGLAIATLAPDQVARSNVPKTSVSSESSAE